MQLAVNHEWQRSGAVLRPISSFLAFMLYCEGDFGYQAGARRHAVAFFGIETATWRPDGPTAAQAAINEDK
jgi:hypothetical protein